MKKRHGFTLIELLIVIAIIAILAAILFPVFNNAKKKAQQSSCASNVRQLVTALKMYAQDCDDTFPNYVNSWSGGVPWHTWADVIDSGYVSNDQVFDCPAGNLHMEHARTVAGLPARYYREDEGYPKVGYSYGINYMPAIPALQITKGGPAGLRQSEVEDATGTILLADTHYWPTLNVYAYVIYRQDYNQAYLIYSVDTQRHGVFNLDTAGNLTNGKFNAGYVDGHVKFQDFSTTIDSGRRLNMWTSCRDN